MTAKADMERVLGMHDNNMQQVSAALIAAGANPHEVLTQEARGFLAGLALRDVVLAAAHQPNDEAKTRKPRKARGPNKVPRKQRPEPDSTEE